MQWKVLGCSAALLVSACALAQVPHADSDEGRELQLLAQIYVREHPSVSVADAITRLAIQGELAPDIEALRVEFTARLTELSIEGASDQHILVQLKGDAPVAGRTITTASGSTRVVFDVGHKYTQDEFLAILSRYRPLLYSTLPGITGTTAFPGEERVLVDIEGDGAQVERLKPAIRNLEQITGLKIDVRPNMPKQVTSDLWNSTTTASSPICSRARFSAAPRASLRIS